MVSDDYLFAIARTGEVFLLIGLTETTAMTTKARLCEICMKPIETDRLETIPETRLCREHAEKIQKHGGEFTLTASVERTSKPGSLKRNYGGVNTRMTRNQAAIEKLKDEFDEERWSKK